MTSALLTEATTQAGMLFGFTADQWKVIVGVAGVAVAVIGGVFSFGAYLLTRYWNDKDKREAEKARHREACYESLKWLGGGSQNRAIGIAIIETNWDEYKELHGLWANALMNQAIYLLGSSEQGTAPHEHDNLRRIMTILLERDSPVGSSGREVLQETIQMKLKDRFTAGLTLTDELKSSLKRWQQQITNKNGSGCVVTHT
jgi:hypothetical protein